MATDHYNNHYMVEDADNEEEEEEEQETTPEDSQIGLSGRGHQLVGQQTYRAAQQQPKIKIYQRQRPAHGNSGRHSARRRRPLRPERLNCCPPAPPGPGQGDNNCGPRFYDNNNNNADISVDCRRPKFQAQAAAADLEEEEDLLQDNVTVIVRIRPKKKSEKVVVAKTIIKVLDSQTLIFDPKEVGEEFYFHGVKQKLYDCSKRANKNMKFFFDYVYGPKHTNVDIFETSLKSIVGHIIHGYSCSVFAYGATGSGKTFTMLGNTNNPGLTYLMAMELYKRIGEIGHEYETEIVVSYLEIYNEGLRDLLHPSQSTLSIRENGLNGVSVPNLTKHKPKDASAMLGLLSYGNKHRTQHPTDHNSESSRSHAIFEVGVSFRRKFTHTSLMKYKLIKAKLVMIDLAGSERGTAGTNARNREGSNINKSLLALGNCINALADGKKHVPYRDSKLTRILKDSLGGNCKTVMITNLSPTNLNFDDTYNSLKYADRAKEITISCTKTILNVDPTAGSGGGGGGHAQCEKIITDLRSEILSLKSVVQEMEAQQRNEASTGDSVDPNNPKVKGSGTILALNASPLMSLTQVVHDPATLEQFIQLLSTKKKHEETHVDATLKAKHAEWSMKWKQWRIETIKNLSAGKGHESSSQEQTHLMKSCLDKLRSDYQQAASTYQLCQEQVMLAKQILDYNEKEIAHLRKNSASLANVKLDEPFLAITLAEFLYYKSLESEVSAHKCIENHHQAMCTALFSEILHSETLLASSLQFQQLLCRIVKDSGLNLSEKQQKRHSELLRSIYGFNQFEHQQQQLLDSHSHGPHGKGNPNSSIAAAASELLNRRRSKQLFDTTQQLINVLQSPVVEYEPPPTRLSTTTTNTINTVLDPNGNSMKNFNVVKSMGSNSSIGSSTFTMSTDANANSNYYSNCTDKNAVSSSCATTSASEQQLAAASVHNQNNNRTCHTIMNRRSAHQQQQLLNFPSLDGHQPAVAAAAEVGTDDGITITGLHSKVKSLLGTKAHLSKNPNHANHETDYPNKKNIIPVGFRRPAPPTTLPSASVAKRRNVEMILMEMYNKQHNNNSNHNRRSTPPAVAAVKQPQPHLSHGHGAPNKKTRKPNIAFGSCVRSKKETSTKMTTVDQQQRRQCRGRLSGESSSPGLDLEVVGIPLQRIRDDEDDDDDDAKNTIDQETNKFKYLRKNSGNLCIKNSYKTTTTKESSSTTMIVLKPPGGGGGGGGRRHAGRKSARLSARRRRPVTRYRKRETSKLLSNNNIK